MDLFDIPGFFDDENVNESPVNKPVDLMNELNIIIKRHGINAPDALLEELTAVYLDPPPWKPW